MIAISKRKMLRALPVPRLGGKAEAQLSLSVAGLVFMMPPVKVIVEQNDAS